MKQHQRTALLAAIGALSLAAISTSCDQANQATSGQASEQSASTKSSPQNATGTVAQNANATPNTQSAEAEQVAHSEPKPETSGWQTDLQAAFAQAKRQNKPVLVEFTGSDWCPPCKMMHAQVFSKEEFIQKASQDYILVVIDIPRGNPQLTAVNEKLMQRYNVRGVPTVILFNPNAQEFDRFTATAFPTVPTFLAHLKSAKARL